MKIEFKNALETIGIFGVIASLIFVGMELRLSRNIALGSAYSERAESRKADLRIWFESDFLMNDEQSQIENGNLPSWWNEDIAQMHTAENIPIAALARTVRLRQIDLIHLDNLLYQKELGLLDDSIVAPVLAVFRRRLNDTPLQAAISQSMIRSETINALNGSN